MATSPDSTGSHERRTQKLVRVLTRLLEAGDLAAFEQKISGHYTPQLLLGMRRHKTLTRGVWQVREGAAALVLSEAEGTLPNDEVAEFKRYVQLCLEVAQARDIVKGHIDRIVTAMPKLSLRQLLFVAKRAVSVATRKSVQPIHDGGIIDGEAQFARRVHDVSGRTNDLWFAVARAINECSRAVGTRDLKRSDAISKSLGLFNAIASFCSQLNALDYALDCASFGDFAVAAHDASLCAFKLEIVDVPLVLIRIMHNRRRLLRTMAGRKEERFVREQLREPAEAVMHNALVRFVARTGGRTRPGPEDMDYLRAAKKLLLLHVDADDDLLWAAASDPDQMALIYHLSVALRINFTVAQTVAGTLPAAARRDFDDNVRLEDILEDLGSAKHRERAVEVWKQLTVALPCRSHWDLMRRPFVRGSEQTAHGLWGAGGDTWPVVAREILIQGGEAGRRYGAIWEEFYSTTFANTGWTMLARNIEIKKAGRTLTEVDLLLLRDDLLLVVEIKALTGSGLNPYDHWKNREVIERGCRQAKLAADHIDANRSLIASVANKKIADRIRHVQPLVLTTEGSFDGWEYAGVPVAGETVRKAITQGTRVEYFMENDSEPFRTDWHLKPEDLSTATILQALRDPIELKIAPEKGQIRYIPVDVANLRLLVPDTGLEDHVYAS